MKDLLPFHGINFIDVVKQRLNVLLLESGLPGINLGCGADFLLRKKLLRSGAGFSTGAMIRPID